MNKQQLVEAVAEQLGGKRAAADAVDAVLDVIVRKVVAGERVSVTGFGTFERVERRPRIARNPMTGDRVEVGKTVVPRFRPGRGFKELAAGAKKLPKLGPAVRKAPKASLTPGKSGVKAPTKKLAAAQKKLEEKREAARLAIAAQRVKAGAR